MNYYTSTIPLPLAEKLKEKGMPMMSCFNITQTGSFSDDDGVHFYYLPTFGACFDWLMSEKGIILCMDIEIVEDEDGWSVFLFEKNKKGIPNCEYLQGFHSWHEATEAAIEEALTLI